MRISIRLCSCFGCFFSFFFFFFFLKWNVRMHSADSPYWGTQIWTLMVTINSPGSIQQTISLTDLPQYSVGLIWLSFHSNGNYQCLRKHNAFRILRFFASLTINSQNTIIWSIKAPQIIWCPIPGKAPYAIWEQWVRRSICAYAHSFVRRCI